MANNNDFEPVRTLSSQYLEDSPDIEEPEHNESVPDDVENLTEIYEIEDFNYANFRKKESLAQSLNNVPFFHDMYKKVREISEA